MSITTDRFLAILAAWTVALFLNPLALHAEQPEAPATETESAADTESEADAEAEKEAKAKAEEEAKRYEVPTDDDSAKLIAFIEQLLTYAPTTREEAVRHQQKAVPALRDAAERLAKLETDPKSEGARLAQRELLRVRLIELRTPDAAGKLYADVVRYMESLDKPELPDYAIAVQVPRILEQLGHDQTADAYAKLGEILAASDTEIVASRGKLMQGAARRIGLVGQEMELKGTTVDGKSFSLADLKGKVVLVDVWATWCGPCRAELPNILTNYEKYHEKGFEVVGVSIDEDRVALEDYLKEKQVPWITLHDQEAKGQHEATVHYAIEAIPFMALIGRDGKVISITARGEVLNQLLAKEFGETATD